MILRMCKQKPLAMRLRIAYTIQGREQKVETVQVMSLRTNSKTKRCVYRYIVIVINKTRRIMPIAVVLLLGQVTDFPPGL